MNTFIQKKSYVSNSELINLRRNECFGLVNTKMPLAIGKLLLTKYAKRDSFLEVKFFFY